MARALFCLTTSIGLYSDRFAPTAGNTPPAAVAARLGKWFVGRDSSVGIMTRYGLDGPGIKSRWGGDFQRLSRPALGPTKPPIQRVRGLSREVKQPESGVDHPPQLAPKLKKE